MGLRINTNIGAATVVRQLSETDRKLVESLERLSSGFRINRGADNPAGLVISEQMRGQIAGLNQAIANSEQASAMVQTAEGALTEVNNILIRIRELALHAANEGATDVNAQEADQIEVATGLESIARTAAFTRFGSRSLLDGSSGISGEAQGEGLTFVSATQRTHTSGVSGYPVVVTQVPTHAFVQGDNPITERNVKNLTVSLFEGGKTVQVTATSEDSPGSFYGRIKAAVEQNGLALDVLMLPDGTLLVRHKEYGSKPAFQVSSSVAGVLSADRGALEAAAPGKDVRGTIAGEEGMGQGNVLQGLTGNDNSEGLAVAYTGPRVGVDDAMAEGGIRWERRPRTGQVGVVNVANNALDFQIGPNPGQRVTFALPPVSPQYMARRVETQSGFRNLAEINVSSAKRAQDAVKLVDAAIDELTIERGQLGGFARNTLQSNINTLRVTAENLMAAESAIRDTDVAQELVEYTRRRIMMEANTALLAQANHTASTVVSLIR
jgi:flagellin